MSTNKKTLAAAVAVVALATAGPAYAQSSLGGYNQTGPDVVGEIQGQTVAGNPDGGGNTPTAAQNVAETTSSGSTAGDRLPFTGSDLGLLAGAGVLLLAFGLGMRRLTRSPDAV